MSASIPPLNPAALGSRLEKGLKDGLKDLKDLKAPKVSDFQLPKPPSIDFNFSLPAPKWGGDNQQSGLAMGHLGDAPDGGDDDDDDVDFVGV